MRKDRRTGEMKMTYEDFKIGERLFCTLDSNHKNYDFYEQHLTAGKYYEITDLDFHFFESVCVEVNNKNSMFIPIDMFNKLDAIRLKKLKKILGLVNKQDKK